MNSPLPLVFPLLMGLTACGGFSLVTLEADPPARILSLGAASVEEDTPYTFRPDDYVPERKQDLQVVLQTQVGAAEEPAHAEYRWRLWYAYGGSLDQVQIPKLDPGGDLWFHRGRDHVLFVQSTPEDVILVENAWACRMDLAAQAATKSTDSPAAGSKTTPSPAIRYRRIAPGHVELETTHWQLEVDVPAGVTFLFEEGAGQGKFVHVAYPRSLTGKVQATQAGEKDPAIPIATKFLSMSRILERDKFSEIYFAYDPDQQLRVEADLGGGRTLVLRCAPKSAKGSRPPLIVCICPGH